MQKSVYTCDFCIFLFKKTWQGETRHFGVIGFMKAEELFDRLERHPVIAAVNEARFASALESPAEVIFHLKAGLLTVKRRIDEAHAAGKAIFVHLDLADGIGKDKMGIAFLAKAGVDGIISTRGALIRAAEAAGVLAVQRFFTLDSQGLYSIDEQLTAAPTVIEIMPGVIGKTVKRFASGDIPVIAGGLIETKAEVTEALANGAAAVSTGKQELWYI